MCTPSATHQNLRNLIAEGKFPRPVYRLSEIIAQHSRRPARDGDALLLANMLVNRFRQQEGRGAYCRSTMPLLHRASQLARQRAGDGKLRQTGGGAGGRRADHSGRPRACPAPIPQAAGCVRCARRQSTRPSSRRWPAATNNVAKPPICRRQPAYPLRFVEPLRLKMTGYRLPCRRMPSNEQTSALGAAAESGAGR